MIELQSVDAYSDIFYEPEKHEIELRIISLINKNEKPIYEVNVCINVFHNKNPKNSFSSKKILKIIFPEAEEDFNEIFILKLNKTTILEHVEIDIFIRGKFNENDLYENTTFSHFCIDGKYIKANKNSSII